MALLAGCGFDLFQGMGVFLQVVGDGADGLEGGTCDVVFHAFDVAVDGVFVDVEEFEEAGQGFVAVDDGAGDAQAFLGEGGAAVFFMGDEAFAIKALQHVSDAGLGDFEFFRDVDGACVSLFLDEVEDLFKIVVAGGRAAGAMGGGHEKELRAKSEESREFRWVGGFRRLVGGCDWWYGGGLLKA